MNEIFKLIQEQLPVHVELVLLEVTGVGQVTATVRRTDVNEGGKTIDELRAAGLKPGVEQRPVFVYGQLRGFEQVAVSSIPPYGAYPPHMYNLYDPTPEKPKPKPGDKRPELTCKKCKNKGKINVSHADGFEVRLMCKLCGKEEVEK